MKHHGQSIFLRRHELGGALGCAYDAEEGYVGDSRWRAHLFRHGCGQESLDHNRDFDHHDGEQQASHEHSTHVEETENENGVDNDSEEIEHRQGSRYGHVILRVAHPSHFGRLVHFDSGSGSGSGSAQGIVEGEVQVQRRPDYPGEQ